MPILCSACDTPTFIWKYDMEKHWTEEHLELLNSDLVRSSRVWGI